MGWSEWAGAAGAYLLAHPEAVGAALTGVGLVVAARALSATARAAKAAEASHGLEAYALLYEEHVDRPVRRPDGREEDWAVVRLASIEQWQRARAAGAPVEVPDDVAREAASRLQRLGLAAFFGSAPLGMLLADVSGRIVADWVLCEAWVRRYREGSPHHPPLAPIAGGDAPGAPYQRRHGEWLALVAAIWLGARWNTPAVDHVLGVGPAALKGRVDLLASIDGQPGSVKDEVERIWRGFQRRRRAAGLPFS